MQREYIVIEVPIQVPYPVFLSWPSSPVDVWTMQAPRVLYEAPLQEPPVENVLAALIEEDYPPHVPPQAQTELATEPPLIKERTHQHCFINEALPTLFQLKQHSEQEARRHFIQHMKAHTLVAAPHHNEAVDVTDEGTEDPSETVCEVATISHRTVLLGKVLYFLMFFFGIGIGISLLVFTVHSGNCKQITHSLWLGGTASSGTTLSSMMAPDSAPANSTLPGSAGVQDPGFGSPRPQSTSAPPPTLAGGTQKGRELNPSTPSTTSSPKGTRTSTSTAIPSPPPKKGDKCATSLLHAIDLDANNKVTYQEFAAVLPAAGFSEVDTNGDGKISSRELRHLPKDTCRMMLAIANGQGWTTEALAAYHAIQE